MQDDQIGKNCEICHRKDYIPYDCKKCKKTVMYTLLSFAMSIIGSTPASLLSTTPHGRLARSPSGGSTIAVSPVATKSCIPSTTTSVRNAINYSAWGIGCRRSMPARVKKPEMDANSSDLEKKMEDEDEKADANGMILYRLNWKLNNNESWIRVNAWLSLATRF